MSYQDVVEVYNSPSLQMRIAACAAIEGEATPEAWVNVHAWDLAAQPGWGDAWAYAKNVFPDDPDLGVRGDVISDAMILSSVQALRSAP